MRQAKQILVVALCVVLLCFAGSWFIQTNGGKIEIHSFSIVTSEGASLSGQIFRPTDATPETPAPTVVTCVGGNNSYSMMRNLNVELARAGYVVVTYSSYKHGSSELLETDTMGASDVLRYVQTLEFADQDRIGVMGHTRGGGYLFKAALSSDCVRAALKLDTVELFGSLQGYDSQTPINCGWIMSNYNEYLLDPLSYSRDTALQRVFGSESTIEVGKTYGNLEQRTVRRLYAVDTIDSAYPFSTGYAAAALDFFAFTLDGRQQLPMPVWPWLEGLSGISIIAMTALMLSLAYLLLSKGGLLQTKVVAENAQLKGARRRIVGGVLLNLAIVAVPFFPLYMLGKRILEPIPLFPQNDTNGLAIWALFAGLLYWLLLFVRGRRYGNSTLHMRLAATPEKLGRTFLVAAATFTAIYLLNLLGSVTLAGTFRLFCTYFEPLTLRRMLAACTCFPLFLLYFLLAEAFRTEPDYQCVEPKWMEYVTSAVFYAGGLILLYALNYLGFPLMGHSLFHAARFAFGPMLAITPVLLIASVISVWAKRKTGKVYFAAFLNTFLFVWLLAGTNAFYYK